MLRAAYRVRAYVLSLLLLFGWPATYIEDAFQRAVARLWQIVANGRGRFSRDAEVSAWLFTGSTNQLRTWRRGEVRREERESGVDDALTPITFPRDEEGFLIYREVSRFLATLDPEARAVLLDRGRGGDDQPLSKDENTLRQKLRRELEALLNREI